MKAMIVLAAIVMLLVAVAVHCQEAPVVQLSAADAASAKITYEALQRAQKAWDAEQKRIALKYLTVPAGDPDASSTRFDGESITGLGVTFGSGALLIPSGECWGYDAKTGQQYAADCSTGKRIEAPPDQLAAAEKEKKAEAEREAVSRHKRVGFDDNCSICVPRFEFSRDFRYIVPPKPEPAKQDCSPFGYGALAPYTAN